MLKNKIDEHIEYLSFTLAMSEDEIRMLRAAFVDIVREAVEEMVGRLDVPMNELLNWQHDVYQARALGYGDRIEEEKAKAEEILNQLK